MIRELDLGLKALLTEKLIRPQSILGSADQIMFEFPEPKSGNPQIGIVLTEIRENLDMRDESFRWERDSSPGRAQRRRAHIWMDVGYLIIADGGGDMLLEHQILADISRIVYAHELLPARHLAGAKEVKNDLPVRLSIVQPDHPFNAKTEQVWRSWQRPMRTCLPLVITAAFNPFEPLPDVPLVREIVSVMVRSSEAGTSHAGAEVKRRTGSAFGYVTESDGKKPIPDVRVGTQNGRHETTTDENGLFAFANLPTGQCRISFTSQGYDEQILDVTIADNPLEIEAIYVRLLPMGPRTVSPRSETPLEYGRREARQISGTLKYKDGLPAAYLPVRVGSVHGATNGFGNYSLTVDGVDSTIYVLLPGVGEVEIPASSEIEHARDLIVDKNA